MRFVAVVGALPMEQANHAERNDVVGEILREALSPSAAGSHRQSPARAQLVVYTLV